MKKENELKFQWEDLEEIEDIDNSGNLELNVSPRTIGRTVWAGAALVNSVLLMMGITPENPIYTGVSILAVVAATIQVWWKNNSFTQKAIGADLVLEGILETKEEN